jgi:hypothetical protein
MLLSRLSSDRQILSSTAFPMSRLDDHTVTFDTGERTPGSPHRIRNATMKLITPTPPRKALSDASIRATPKIAMTEKSETHVGPVTRYPRPDIPPPPTNEGILDRAEFRVQAESFALERLTLIVTLSAGILVPQDNPSGFKPRLCDSMTIQ